MSNKKLSYDMKRDRVRALLSAYPDKSDKEYAQELRVLEAEGLVTPEPVAPVTPEPVAQGVGAILEERGSRYGPFVTHAEITCALKEVMYIRGGYSKMAPDQREALDMIFHKIGRIINGDPNYADSWIDIAGYAQLVVDRLEGKVR